ncbi:MAG: tetratricopeptide repeat protein [Bacteroidota bacterium]
MASPKKKITKKKKKTLSAQWQWLKRKRPIAIGLFVLSVLLYANTFQHDFAQDDAIVITENMFTTEGVSGLGGLFKYDTFYGFFKEEGKDKLVSGGRYRPLTPAMFAVEYEIFGENPAVMHVLNALWYGLTTVVLYLVLLQLFVKRSTWDKNMGLWAVYWIPLVAAILFAVHPVHTEAVANIKGRDEIITLLGSLGALWFLLRGGLLSTVLAGVSFFLALLAKENAITFIGVVPLAFYFFTKEDAGAIVRRFTLLVGVAGLFLIIRGGILGWSLGEPSRELMNNPFLKIEQGFWVDFSSAEKSATVTYTLGKYAQLLVAPFKLTHDYYPRHVDIMNWGSWQALLSLLLYLGLFAYGIWGLVRRHIGSFAVLVYLGTLSIVSNIVFPVGTNMSERFLFMPSIGYALLIAWGLTRFVKNQRLATIIIGVYCLVLAGLTMLRNPAWENNFELFTTDIHTSVNSAKLRNAMAGELSVQWEALPETQKNQRTDMLNEALGHINEAIRIHPTYKQAYYIQGNILNYLKRYDEAAAAYQRALQIDGGYTQAFDNLMITYLQAGRYYGEQLGDVANSIRYLELANSARPNDYETIRLLGVANGIAGNTGKAIELFRKNTELQPQNARAWYDLGTAYYNNRQVAEAEQALQRARQIDPEIDQKVQGAN